MYGKDMALPEDRLEMCNLMCERDGRMKTFDYEIRHQLRGETYHFVKQLLEEPFAKDEYEFSVVIGLDNANTFDKWVNYEDLVKTIPFVVVTRIGVERNPKVDWYLRPPHVFLSAEQEIMEVSSTFVRNMILKSDSAWNHLLDEKVVDYIVRRRLYGIMMREIKE
jgi:nicotinate-nucleotide adenylyltransferase